MDLRKLPPSLLVVLGLACSRTPPTVGPCLSPPYDPLIDDAGGCLSPPDDDELDTTGDEPPVEPCLSPVEPPPQDGGGASAAAAGAAPSVASRREVLERVLARATLPPDVAARLRGTAP
jgi:hypothetical protein